MNVVYAALAKPCKPGFPAVLALGLGFSMAGDLLLGWNFILGAGLFALGHVLYAAAMYMRQRFAWKDAALSVAMLVLSLAILNLTPGLSFSVPQLQVVCYVYALIISCMAGKAVSGFLREKTLTGGLLALGSVLFFFSDVMLVLAWFADVGRWADLCCLSTYFPGQGLLAHAVYHHVRNQAPTRCRRDEHAGRRQEEDNFPLYFWESCDILIFNPVPGQNLPFGGINHERHHHP